jgi:hypothetical protein
MNTGVYAETVTQDTHFYPIFGKKQAKTRTERGDPDPKMELTRNP